MTRSGSDSPTSSPPDRDDFEQGRVPIEYSGWLPTEPLPRHSPLIDDVETDVVVIGAGLAGASTFLHLVEAGAQAVLVEARQPADGASGRNAGHYLPYLDDLETFERWPDGMGRRFFQYSVEHRNIVYEICEKYGLEADCEQSGGVQASRNKARELATKAAFWSQHGVHMEEVGREELTRLLGTDYFGHGIVGSDGGRMNPYLFTHGMVGAAIGLGGRVHADSPVQTCSREGQAWRVRTPAGSVLARRIVICTAGNHGNAFFPELGRTNYPLVASALATRPLPDELVRTLIPSGLVVEQHPGLNHMLLDGRNRLISSTIPAVGRAYDADHYFSVFLRWLNRSFPVSRDFGIELESYWSGMMFNSSHVYQRDYPQVFRLDEGAYALLNLGSWGNFMGPLLGRSLGRALAADRPDDFVMPILAPKSVRWPGLFDFKIRRLAVPAGRLADRLGLV